MPSPFLSTLSLRRATNGHETAPYRVGDFYPRSPCGERLLPSWELYQMLRISIHALLAESDGPDQQHERHLQNFYPRSPCGERPPRRRKPLQLRPFLSTLSLRRATLMCHTLVSTIRFLSTLSLRRATGIPNRVGTWEVISIHALLAESDPVKIKPVLISTKFLSTLSLRRATTVCKAFRALGHISIHALLAESDSKTLSRQCRSRISIHALLAESDAYGRINDISRLIFLSTLSLRRATV